MTDKNHNQGINVRIIKAETPSQIQKEVRITASEWIQHPVEMEGLKALEKHSAILPQCVRAYKQNIAGFGIGVKYKEDLKETPEMVAEFTRAEEIVELLNLDFNTKEVFEHLVEAREIYGIAYLEVIRNIAGEVVQIEFIKDTSTILKTYPLEPYIESDYNYKDRSIKKRKKYRKYKQEIAGKTVYFKEFGDPRLMDARSGDYGENEGNDLEIGLQANEILEFALGTEPYGEVRWIGQILGVDGSRKAEGLNNNYFENGRHTPLMILIRGGTLTDESFTKLQNYMSGIKGESGQHAFIVLETENITDRSDFEEKQAEIEIKDLASILQKDELFQEYLENNRRRIQSAFQLPDLYVGYTTDFNRATAQTAMEITEKQVFQPERISLAWAINNKLLNEYQFKYVEAYFKAPDISNPDDLAKILNVTERAGGLTPNKAKEIAHTVMGSNFEPYEGDWADMPLVYTKNQGSQSAGLTDQLEQQIKKAAAKNDDAIVAIMKEVRSLLVKIEGGR